MSETPYFTRLVNLSQAEIYLVKEFAQHNRLGPGGFSASLRAILYDWAQLREALQNLPETNPLSKFIVMVPPAIAPEDIQLEDSEMELEYPAKYDPDMLQGGYNAAMAKLHARKFSSQFN